MNNKAIFIVNLSGTFGGAEKRYINLYNYISSFRDDYHLIIDNVLYEKFMANDILKSSKNIHIVQLKKVKPATNSLTKQIHSEIRTNSTNLLSEFCISVKILLIQLRKFIKSLFYFLKIAFFLKKIIINNKIDFIYTVWMAGFYAWPLRKLFSFTHIHSYNDTDIGYLKTGFLNWFDTEYNVLLHCDKIDFLSAGILPKLEEKIGKIDISRISITPNSFILYSDYKPVYPKKNEVVFLGRLVQDRNPMLFLEGINHYLHNSKSNINVKFKIIGEGIYMQQMIKYVEENSMYDFVEFTGISYRPWEHLQSSKIFVTVANENYPSQSLLEAMACENAIIATDLGETRILLTDKEAILIKKNSAEIAEAIAKLFSTPGLIEVLGRNARRKAIRDHTIEKYFGYFDTLMQVQ